MEWLEHHDYSGHGLSSKPTHAILLHPRERNFMVLFPAWWSWQAVLNVSHMFRKLKNQNKEFQLPSNMLTSLEGGQGNCLPYV